MPGPYSNPKGLVIEGGGGSKPKPKKKFSDKTRVKAQVMERKAMSPVKKNKRPDFKNPDLTDLNNELRGRGDAHALEQIAFHEANKNRQPTLYRQVINNYKALDEKLGGVLPGGGHLKEYARALTVLVTGHDPQNPIPEEPLIKTWDDRNVRNNNTKLNPK